MSTAIEDTYVSKRLESQTGSYRRTSIALWAMLALYIAARFLQLVPDRVSIFVILAMHVVPVTIFALIHGASRYRWSGVLTFAALSLVVGHIFENLSVHTGFPYGHYYFTNLMGPKLARVPLSLGLAYVGMGYLSWTLARLILGDAGSRLRGSRVVTVPLIAAFIMVAWDLSQDPIWGTVLHLWIWRDGGAYFGVPVSNFLGWYLTVWVFYQLFALYLRRSSIDSGRLPSGFWRSAVLFYGVSAAGNILLVIPRAGLSSVTDVAGVQWNVSDITGTCALVSIFLMGAFCLLAWVRLADAKAEG